MQEYRQPVHPDRIRPPTLPASPGASPLYYVLVPHALVSDLRDTPVALGVYALVARLYRIHQQPIPLSPSDLHAYDPALKRGAVVRAFQRLVKTGWLVAQRQHGHKARYTPTWGLVQGKPRPWDLAAPLLGCPRRHQTVRLDQRLLDTCLGKLTPHPVHPATIERYLATPLLGLRDVGAYLCTLGGWAHATAALDQLQLVQHGTAQPLADDATLLALVSQQALTTTTPVLTEAGWATLGVLPVDPPPAAASGDPLFFVPPAEIGRVIGTMIGKVIGSASDGNGSNTAPQRAERVPATAPVRSHGSEGSEGLHESTPLPPTPGGGMGDSDSDFFRPDPAFPETPALPDTESALLLRAINVRPPSIRACADMPCDQVAAVIRYARARPEVRDLAGWVVSALRDVRDHGWQIPDPVPPDRDQQAADTYLAQLRASGLFSNPSELAPPAVAPTPVPSPAPTSDQQAADTYLARLRASGVFSTDDAPCPTPVPEPARQCAAQPTTTHAAPHYGTDAVRDGLPPRAPSAPPDLATHTAALREALCVRVPRQQWPLVATLTLVGDPAQPCLVCTDPRQYGAVIAQLQPLLRVACAEVGLPSVGPLLLGSGRRC